MTLHTSHSTHTLTLLDRANPDAPGTTRRVEGIAVPWDSVADIGPYRERFARGAIDPTKVVGLNLYWNHDRHALPLGRIDTAEDRDAGLWIGVDIPETTAGRDVHALAKAGVLDRFSVSFLDVPGGTTQDAEGLVTRTAADVREVSITAWPAYTEARVTNVRHTPDPSPDKEPLMPETTASPDLAELRSANEDLTRRLALLETGNTAPAGDSLRFRSLGEVIKGLVDRSINTTAEDLEAVQKAYRDAAEDRAIGVLADTATPKAWIDRDIKLVDRGRPIINAFSREPLPDEGESVDYPKFLSSTDGTGKQAAEGDNLGYVDLKFTTANAAVDTYGNYASLSRQSIERGSVAYLNKVLTAQKIFYGKATNKVVRDVLVNSTGTNTGLDISTRLTEGKAWIEAAMDAAGKIDDNSVGLTADLWIMSRAHFTALATLFDTAGRPVFELNGDGSNTIGSANPVAYSGSFPGLTLLVDPTLTGVTSYICSRDAITTLESPGAPFSLSDETVINLTKNFALYGYLAATVNDPKGIVKVKTSAA